MITRRRLFQSVAALAALASSGLVARSAAAQYYDGPVSDHFDGVRFFDPDGSAPKSFSDVLRWYLTSEAEAWPQAVPVTAFDKPPSRVEGPQWRLSFVGHVTWLIQTQGLNILTDPVWSERASPFTFAGPKRVTEPGIALADLPKIDVVLVTHNHYDHLDIATLKRLTDQHNPRVITPLGNDAIMRAEIPAIRAEAYDWGAKVDLGQGLGAHLEPVRHWSARGVFDRNKALWAAFMLDTAAGKLFFVGDSGYGDGTHFRRVRDKHGAIRLVLMPIGAYEPRWFMRDQHMNPEEAVLAYRDCGAESAIGHHFGTFRLTDEGLEAPQLALSKALFAQAIPPEDFRTLTVGEAWTA